MSGSCFQSWVRSLVAHCGARVASKLVLAGLSALFFLLWVWVLRCHGDVEMRAEEGHKLLGSVREVPQMFRAGDQEEVIFLSFSWSGMPGKSATIVSCRERVGLGVGARCIRCTGFLWVLACGVLVFGRTCMIRMVQGFCVAMC